MYKIWQVALRDFKATVLTRAFLIGVLLTPVILVVSIGGVMLLTSDKPPAVKGSVAIFDQSAGAVVAPGIAERLTPAAVEAAVDRETRKQVDAAKAASARVLGDSAGKLLEQPGVDAALAAAKPEMPQITTEVLGADAELEREKDRIRTGSLFEGDRLALVVVTPGAVVRPAGAEQYAGYELFVNDRLDVRVQSLLRDQIGAALLDARIRGAGLNPDEILAMARVVDAKVTALTPAGERKANPAAQFIIPMAFMILVWIAVFSGGQMLLTNTIEEKSSRVMEVLLSAVSPVQLMTGKICGQLMVGLIILVIYSGMGLLSLVWMARADLIRPEQLVYLIIFFLIAYFLIASLMAAVGSAVSDLQEANALLGPVMMIVMLPMILMVPIMQNPKSMFAQVASFVPPINPFVMLLRVSSTDPPPFWQVGLSMLIGIAAAVVAVRIAAKIFRIGVLLYGKPPNFRTLIKWVRMA